MMKSIWSAHSIIDSKTTKNKKKRQGVDPLHDDGTLAKLYVPDGSAEVIWDAKTLLRAKRLEASTTSMHGILRNQINNRTNNHRNIAKNHKGG